MPTDGKVPRDLGRRYGRLILEADGFAQARAVSGCWIGVWAGLG